MEKKRIEDRIISLSSFWFNHNSLTSTTTTAGAVAFMEADLGSPMMWLACLHHVLELLLEKAIAVKLGPSSGPREKYFARFESFFNSMNNEEKEKI